MPDLNLENTPQPIFPKRLSEAEKLIKKNKRNRRKRLVRAKAKGMHTKHGWLSLLKEFRKRCVKCLKRAKYIQKDHIVPIYLGGSDGIENIQPLCRKCNLSKYSETFNWKEYRRAQGWPG